MSGVGAGSRSRCRLHWFSRDPERKGGAFGVSEIPGAAFRSHLTGALVRPRHRASYLLGVRGSLPCAPVAALLSFVSIHSWSSGLSTRLDDCTRRSSVRVFIHNIKVSFISEFLPATVRVEFLKAYVTLLQTTRKMALSLTPSPLRALAPGRAMEGQAGTASAPAPPRRSTRCPCVMRSGFPPSDEDEGGGARDCHG